MIRRHHHHHGLGIARHEIESGKRQGRCGIAPLGLEDDGCRLFPEMGNLLCNQEAMFLVAHIDGITQPRHRIQAAGGFLQQRALGEQGQQGLGEVFARKRPET